VGDIRYLSVVGARPQFIKAIALTRELARRSIEEIIVHTGQHFDTRMSKVFFDELQLPRPKYNLGVSGSTHGVMTGGMLSKLDEILARENPTAVIVFGDTNSTLAGALSAVKQHIPVAHMEAGMRSYDRTMPEEVNRVVVDVISKFLFSPNEEGVTNLKKEGVYTGNEAGQHVFNVGDIMYDTFCIMQDVVEDTVVERLGLRSRQFVLATVHRPSNTDRPEALAQTFELLSHAGRNVCPVVMPLHPRTALRARELGVPIPPELKVIEPVSYVDMLGLLRNCFLVMTDSGGMQKEALWAGVPCLTLRDVTEWTDTVKYGFNFVVSRDMQKLKKALQDMH
jgi:UDP-N-acetylglucosamine 2-epimerase